MPALDTIWDNTRAHRRAEEQTRRERPLVRLFNSEWALQHVVGSEYRAEFSWVSNDTGPGRLELPADSPEAVWIHDYEGRLGRGEGRGVFVTVDHCGARWSGIMDKYALEQREDGDNVLVVDFMHDYEALKWRQMWCNPWLPAAFQLPRAFVLAGPVTWILKTALFLQIFREHNPLVTWPDDPFDLSYDGPWFTSLNQSQWHTVVKPTSFLEASESGVVWGVLISRFATWHDACHTMLEDAELSVRCDRFLPGDPPPWPGANLRYGTLVVDIVDKSGIYVGTSHGGDVFDGLVRTVVEFADDFIDSTLELVADAETPQDYFLPGSKYTDPVKPYVVFQEGESSPIQSSGFINSPAKGVQVTVGGHSMPGVNEAISATIQAAFDIVGSIVQVGSLGGTVDTLLQPLYEDTILAWHSVKSAQRAQNQGWSQTLYEYFQQGSDRAYTLAALAVLRAGFYATKTQISWKVSVADGLPFMVGDRGVGHFWLDDRVGLRIKGSPKIHMDRCRKIDLAWDEENPAEWQITIGDDRIFQDPAQRAWGKIESLVAGLRDLGVW